MKTFFPLYFGFIIFNKNCTRESEEICRKIRAKAEKFLRKAIKRRCSRKFLYMSLDYLQSFFIWKTRKRNMGLIFRRKNSPQRKSGNEIRLQKQFRLLCLKVQYYFVSISKSIEKWRLLLDYSNLSSDLMEKSINGIISLIFGCAFSSWFFPRTI